MIDRIGFRPDVSGLEATVRLTPCDWWRRYGEGFE